MENREVRELQGPSPCPLATNAQELVGKRQGGGVGARVFCCLSQGLCDLGGEAGISGQQGAVGRHDLLAFEVAQAL